jgi:hypothetical protein
MVWFFPSQHPNGCGSVQLICPQVRLGCFKFWIKVVCMIITVELTLNPSINQSIHGSRASFPRGQRQPEHEAEFSNGDVYVLSLCPHSWLHILIQTMRYCYFNDIFWKYVPWYILFPEHSIHIGIQLLQKLCIMKPSIGLTNLCTSSQSTSLWSIFILSYQFPQVSIMFLNQTFGIL